MKIGIFDSGLGGLYTARSIIKHLPGYSYVYLGDTKNLPYGDKSPARIYTLLRAGVEFLFEQDCSIVIVACNTASTEALRKIQQEYLTQHYPDRKVLGVIVPTIEETLGAKKVGVIATNATVASGSYPQEIKKVNKKVQVFQEAAPTLVPIIENGEKHLIRPFLEKYLAPLCKKKIDTLILGCTHYPIVKNTIKTIVGKNVKVVSQDEFIYKKLRDYLHRHVEIADFLDKKKRRTFFVTEKTKHFEHLAKLWFPGIKLQEVKLGK